MRSLYVAPDASSRPSRHAEIPAASIEAAVVRLSLTNLMTFPWISEAVAAGQLTLYGFRFDIHTGVLLQVEADGERPVE